MIECQVAECENLEEDSRGFCQTHLRRFIAGNVYEDESGQMVDHCLNDHALVGDNVRWESSGKNGKKRKRCRECLRLKAQRQSRNHAAVVEPPKPYRPNDLTLSRAIDDFEEANQNVAAKCRDNPAPYIDWDPEDDNVPTEEEARALCHGCPLLKACANYGRAAQMSDGVWGGRRVVRGQWI